jgi:lactoylglutathione lyase
MTSRYLHTMVRVTDPARSRAFYEALGMEFRREAPIVRNGETEATLYFLGFPGQEEELELTFNHDGSTYELGTAYGHIAIGVDDLDATLAQLAEQGIEAERPVGCVNSVVHHKTFDLQTRPSLRTPQAAATTTGGPE